MKLFGRRSEGSMTGPKCSVFRFSDVEVHERELQLKRAGESLPVEPKVFRVLVHLVRNPGCLIPKDELLNAGWGNTAPVISPC